MLGTTRDEVEADPLRHATAAAERWNATVLLKGRRTLVAHARCTNARQPQRFVVARHGGCRRRARRLRGLVAGGRPPPARRGRRRGIPPRRRIGPGQSRWSRSWRPTSRTSCRRRSRRSCKGVWRDASPGRGGHRPRRVPGQHQRAQGMRSAVGVHDGGQGRRLRPWHGADGARRAPGRLRVARGRHDRRGARAAQERRPGRRPVLAGGPGRGLRGADRRGHRGHGVVGRTARRDPGRTDVRTPQGPAQGRHRSVAQRRPGRAVDRAGRGRGGRPDGRRRRDHRRLVALRVRRPAGPPGQRSTGGGVRRGRRRAQGGRHRTSSAAPEQLRRDVDQACGPLRARPRRHRVVRHPARSRTHLPDRS